MIGAAVIDAINMQASAALPIVARGKAGPSNTPQEKVRITSVESCRRVSVPSIHIETEKSRKIFVSTSILLRRVIRDDDSREWQNCNTSLTPTEGVGV